MVHIKTEEISSISKKEEEEKKKHTFKKKKRERVKDLNKQLSCTNCPTVSQL